MLEQSERIFMEVTNYCNFRCDFCPQAISTRIPQHMDITLAKNLIQQLYEAGYKNSLYFHLLGEPLLYPHLLDLSARASANVVLCHLDYDGKTSFANVKDGKLSSLLKDVKVQEEIDGFRLKGIVPKNCQYCTVPTQYSQNIDN